MRKLLLTLLLIISCATPLNAEDKPYVVLALSGGGIKGYAHVGVLEVLERENIGIAGIVGTSMGAIVGSLYASGKSVEELNAIIKDTDLGALVTATGTRYFYLSENAAQDVSMIRPEIHSDKDGMVVGPLGIVPGTAVLEYIAQLLSNVTVTDFSQLPIPFAAVATDLATGEKVVLRRGSLASAVRASMSLPVVFDPWEIDGRLLIDGGMVSNMPVETAKELFPGYPVIAINLTSELEPREKLNTVLSVINQSITILTMQNVQREAELADLLINPGVKEYPILGTSASEEIIQQGRDAAEKVLPELRELVKTAPRHPIKPKTMDTDTPRIIDVRVTGVPEGMAAEIRHELLKNWLGRKVSMKNISEVSSDLAKREDIRSVDYDLEENDRGVTVVLKLQRLPERIYSVGGYGSTFTEMGWLKVEAKTYDLMTPGDTLQARLYLNEYWGADLNYYWGMDVHRDNYWEAGLSATHFKYDATNGPLKWQRYAFDIRRHHIYRERLHMSGGLTIANISHVSGGENTDYIAPFIETSLNMMDDLADPRNGWLASVNIMWPEGAGGFLMRASLAARAQISDDLIGEVSGGFAEGESEENRVYAAYLGAREELYSLAEHPLAAERFLWWRAKLRYPITETMFGPLVAELFGGQGYAWDNDNSSIAQPWEVGLALCTPRKLIDGRVYAVYSDHEEWRFGVRVGAPDWDVFHIF